MRSCYHQSWSWVSVERESDFVNGGSLLWEAGVEV